MVLYGLRPDQGDIAERMGLIACGRRVVPREPSRHEKLDHGACCRTVADAAVCFRIFYGESAEKLSSS